MKACVLHAARDVRVEQHPLGPSSGPVGAKEVAVQFAIGGICGSDIHYYFEGRVGDFPVKEPLVLGHEMAGVVAEVGADIENVSVGDRVTINPMVPCHNCPRCHEGRPNLCREMNFLGSAAVSPHIQGAFQEKLIVTEAQCHRIPDHLSFESAAAAEPLSVALHAVSRAGALSGRHVLVTGSGPIGALIVRAARNAGAASVTITDVVDAPLAISKEMGATQTINIANDTDAMTDFAANKGYFDAAIEASGNDQALKSCIACTHPGGRVVQVGMMHPGDHGIPMNMLMAKEIELAGSFRFHDEFGWAVDYLSSGQIDVTPVLTATMPVSQLDDAFELARNRNEAMKVQLTF